MKLTEKGKIIPPIKLGNPWKMFQRQFNLGTR